jgi:hypothetical protein
MALFNIELVSKYTYFQQSPLTQHHKELNFCCTPNRDKCPPATPRVSVRH